MDNKCKEAVKIFNMGFSCSQSVLCVYCDETGFSESIAMSVASPYAGGAHIECGALIAAEIVLLRALGNTDNHDPLKMTQESEVIINKFRNDFKNKNKSINCRELRGGFGKTKLRSCVGCVEDSVKLLDEYLIKLKK